MAKYRKKPVIIDAVQLKPDRTSIINAVEFVFEIGMETSIAGTDATCNKIFMDGGFIIPTLEGNMFASFWNYIIKGVNGEFYPCKPDIFEKTYEKVEETV